MFESLPPYIHAIQASNIDSSIIRSFQLHHNTAFDRSYLSLGEKRQDESHCIFHYTVKGHGNVTYMGKQYRTSPGEGFFNIINEVGSGYGYYDDSGEPWEFVVISFEGGNVRQIVKNMLEQKVIYTISNTSAFALLCQRLVVQRNNEMILTFFPTLLSYIYESQSLSLLISSFNAIVERDLMLNPTIYAIAEELHISREHLQREYQKQTGVTPSKYLENKRFERLCYLLTVESNLTRIAQDMSFSSVSSMNLFFKRIAHITPQQYRKNGYFDL